MTGNQIHDYLVQIADTVFGFDLEQYLNSVDRNLVGFNIDVDTTKLSVLFGNVPEEFLALMNQYPIRQSKPIAAAGYRVEARPKFLTLSLSKAQRKYIESWAKDFDIFLIANDVLNATETQVKAIVFHELGHLVDEARIGTFGGEIDESQGDELYASLPAAQFRKWHSRRWCAIISEAAKAMHAAGEPFHDFIDVISHAMYYDYESDRGVFKRIVDHHVQNRNRPSYLADGYAPAIDAVYRSRVNVAKDFEVTDEIVALAGGITRHKHTITQETYQEIKAIRRRR